MDMLYRLAVKRVLGREQGRDTRVERKEKTRKKNCLLCRPGLTQGWLGWAIFSRVFRLSQKAAKKEEAFFARPTPLPLPPPRGISRLDEVARNIWRPRVYFGYWEQT